MNRKPVSVWLMAALAVVATIAAACGSTPTTGGSTPNKGKLTVAGFNFPESSILAYVYGKALEHDGYTVTYKVNLGTREVVAPALKSGQIDLYPGYAATDLEYWDQSKGLATGGADGTIRLWAPRTMRSLGAFTCGNGPVAAIAFSSDGTLLAGGSGDAARCWDVTPRPRIQKLCAKFWRCSRC